MEVVVKDAVNILHFRGDLSFTKVDENGTPLANIAFLFLIQRENPTSSGQMKMGITRRQLPIFHIRIIRIRKRQVRVSGLDRQTWMIRRAHCRMERITSKRFAVRQIK